MRGDSLNQLFTMMEIVILSLLLVFSFYLIQPIQSENTINIPKGSITKVITSLQNSKYDIYTIDRYLLRMTGTPQSGWIHIGKTKLSRLEFLYRLTNAKAKIYKITLIPGETLSLFTETIAKEFLLDQEKLIRAYMSFSPYLEAGIYADTYFLPYGIKEEALIQFLVAQSEKKYRSLSLEFYGDYNQTKWQEILTIASIIQKEAANNQEMPIVASVIYNRLQKQMRLQMDGTLNYGKYSHTKITPQRIQEDNTTFNTYKHKGVPNSPVGAVGLSALLATLKPATTPYLYFMKNKKGVHDFTEDYRSHKSNIHKAKERDKNSTNYLPKGSILK